MKLAGSVQNKASWNPKTGICNQKLLNLNNTKKNWTWRRRWNRRNQSATCQRGKNKIFWSFLRRFRQRSADFDDVGFRRSWCAKPSRSWLLKSPLSLLWEMRNGLKDRWENDIKQSHATTRPLLHHIYYFNFPPGISCAEVPLAFSFSYSFFFFPWPFCYLRFYLSYIISLNAYFCICAYSSHR